MFFITITIILGNTRNPRPASKKFWKNSAKRQRESRTFYRYTKVPLILTVPGSSTDGRHQVSSDLSVNMRTDHDLFKLTDSRQNNLFWDHSFNPSFNSSDSKLFWWILSSEICKSYNCSGLLHCKLHESVHGIMLAKQLSHQTESEITGVGDSVEAPKLKKWDSNTQADLAWESCNDPISDRGHRLWRSISRTPSPQNWYLKQENTWSGLC